MPRPATARRADPADRLAVAHDRLLRAVEDLASSDAWRRMLEVAARFSTYSANNVLLIGVQRPDATRVAGIRTWNSLGRHVRKGEKGIAILAPCLYRARDAEPAPSPARADPAERQARALRGFRVVHVFDVAQTEGKPLPDVGPAQLTGSAPPQLIAGLTAALTADGYAVERGPCGAANGYTDFRTRTVRVRDDVAHAQAAKTLTHELAHIRADHEHRFLATYATSAGCRAQAEVEAESIAYVVTTVAGMAAESYSVPYVAGWAGGDPDLLRAAATRVLATAREIVHDLGLIAPDVTEFAALRRGVGGDRAAPTRDPASR